MKRHAAAVLLCGALLSGCGGLQDFIADAVLPPQQAAQLGRQMAQQIEAQKGLAQDPAMQRRVARVGQQVLTSTGELPDAYDFSFKVLEDDQTVNAFALPGGHIYATSALMNVASTDAQLASVLAHEVAHVTQRHIADRLATSFGVQALGAAALGQDAGIIAQLAGSVLQQGFLLKYSREQELQADAVGLRYLAQAGYDPHSAIAMFRKLGPGGTTQAPAFFSSHPATGERIERLQELIASGDYQAAISTAE